jgi:hypothetical protein
MTEISEELKRLWRDRDNNPQAPPASIVLDEPEDEPVLEVLEESPPAVRTVLPANTVLLADTVLPSTIIQQSSPVISGLKLHAVQNCGLEELDFSSYVWRR